MLILNISIQSFNQKHLILNKDINKLMIEKYITEMEALGKSPASIENLRCTFKKFEQIKPLDEMTKDDLIMFFKNCKGSENSKRLYMSQIKKFYKYCGKDELVNWIKLPRIKEKRMDVLVPEDIDKLIEATINPYWKAYIAFAFETGGRFEEMRELHWRDIKDDCSQVNIMTQKTSAGLRIIPLRMSLNYIMNLKLQVNASKDDIVFPISEVRALEVLKEIAAKAGIKKKVHPHAFRHACATYLVETGQQEAKIRYQLGWTQTSPMIARYQHLRNDILINDESGKPKTQTIKAAENTIGELKTKMLVQEEENRDLKKRLERLEAYIADQERAVIATDEPNERYSEQQIKSMIEAVKAGNA